MFSVKFKIKEGRNTLPRHYGSQYHNARRNSNSSDTGSLKSSLISNKSNQNRERKNKKVRIITTREKDKYFGERESSPPIYFQLP